MCGETVGAGDGIEQGLAEAIEFAGTGQVASPPGARIHRAEMPQVDAAAIRPPHRPLASRLRAQHQGIQGNAAQLGTRPPPSHRPGARAAGDDREETLARGELLR